jgi:hypothetical protein
MCFSALLAVPATSARRAVTVHLSVGLPVVACPTGETPDLTGKPLKRNAKWVWVQPQNLPRYTPDPAGLPIHVAAQLARYEGDVRHARDLNVLAPRGWNCSAYIPEDGNSYMVVAPPGAKPRERITVTFRWAGQGAFLACDYFKSARAYAPQPDLCRMPAHTTITLRNNHLATSVTTPAGGWTPFAARSFLYWYPRGREVSLLAVGASCVLPPSEQILCKHILAEAQRRQGNEP